MKQHRWREKGGAFVIDVEKELDQLEAEVQEISIFPCSAGSVSAKLLLK